MKLYSPTSVVVIILLLNRLPVSLPSPVPETTPVDVQEATVSADDLLNQGTRYEFGDGVQQDYALARQYYEKAIAAGSVQAMHNLGVLYDAGSGVSKDRQKALELWALASSRGNGYSSFNVGRAFLGGDGVPQQPATALEYFMRSYEQGYQHSICVYGDVLQYTNPQNSGKTRALLTPLARQGNATCLSALVALLYADFAQHQDSEALISWAEAGAKQNIPSVLFTLGQIYDFGVQGIPADADKARQYYLRAAELAHAEAYTNLGYMYETGKFGNPDLVIARKYYEQAVALNSINGINNLAAFYRNGTGTVKDLDKAFALYSRAAEMGSSTAQLNLGTLYRYGFGVEQDGYQAEAYMLKAVELGEDRALLNLGLLYLDESLPLFNKMIAITYLFQAADKNVPKALEVLSAQLDDKERESFAMARASGQVAFNLALYYRAEQQEAKACNWFLLAHKRQHEDAYLEVMSCINAHRYADQPYTDPLEVAREWAIYKGWDVPSFLGELVYYGMGVDEDKALAARYFQQSHETSGDSIARYNLGTMYLNGDGVAKDFGRATYYLELAAEQGVTYAAYELATLYQQGNDVVADADKAFKYMGMAAAALDNPDAAYFYADMLYAGETQPQDINEAIDWYDRAIQQGHHEAVCKLADVLASHYRDDEDLIRSDQLKQRCEANALKKQQHTGTAGND